MINCYSVHFIKLIVMTFHLFIYVASVFGFFIKDNLKTETGAERNDAQLYIIYVNLAPFLVHCACMFSHTVERDWLFFTISPAFNNKVVEETSRPFHFFP